MEPLEETGICLSYTQLNDYRTCPKRFYHRWLAKDCPPDDKSIQQIRGTNAHEAIKKRLKLREPLPTGFEQYENICQGIEWHNDKMEFELGLGATIDGKPCGFFDDICGLRTRIDLVMFRQESAVIIDWKTGKTWEDPFELQIQAMLLYLNQPELMHITGFYFWLKTNKPGAVYDLGPWHNTVSRWDQIKGYTKAIKYRLDNNDWPPDENALCPWCPVTKEMCSFKREMPR